MTILDGILIVCAVATGLFSGLMMALVVVYQRIWEQMPPTDYISAMQRFLPAAKGHPVIATATLLPIGLSGVGVALAWGQTWPMLLIGLGGVFALGVLLVTVRVNFPIYEAMMAWPPSTPPELLDDGRRQFGRSNRVRWALGLAAQVCFASALALG